MRSAAVLQLANRVQRRLARSKSAVALAVLVRNQCSCIIKYHLAPSPDLARSGELLLARMVAPQSSTFVDVGANVGDWIACCFALRPRDRRALLFEPSRSALEALARRFAGLADIEIVGAAVSDEPADMLFYEEAHAGQHASLVAGCTERGAVERVVPATTLDGELEQRGWDRIDFLKIDAEGYDLRALKGAAGLFDRAKIGVVQFEYNKPWRQAGSTLADALAFFRQRAYHAFLLRHDGLFEFDYSRYGEYFEYSNFVAVAPDVLPQLRPAVKGRV